MSPAGEYRNWGKISPWDSLCTETWPLYDPTPEGYWDLPFMYIFDGSTGSPTALTNGSSYMGLTIPLDGDADFILRATTGWNNMFSSAVSYFQIYGPRQQRLFSTRARHSGALGQRSSEVPIIPNWQYPAGGQIRFDLYNVSKTTGGGSVDHGYLGFAGVKRYRGSPLKLTTLPYRLLPFQHILVVPTVTWLKSSGQWPKYTVKIDNFAFEWQRLVVTSTDSNGNLTGLANFKFYDCLGNSLSNLPIPDCFCVDMPVYNGDADAAPLCFPVPSLAYPESGQIVVEVQNPNNFAGDAFQMCFIGMKRVPCV